MELPTPTPPPPAAEVRQPQGGGNSSCKPVWVDAEFSVYVGNLDPDASVEDMEELIYELFLQAGPLSKVYIPFSQDSNRHKGFGFVEFQHVESVSYSLQLMAGIRLCGRALNLGPAMPAIPPPSSVSSVTSSGNPFVSAFESHVTQKEGEMVAANPFLSSLNTYLGGHPLPPPPYPPLPPPPYLPPPVFLLPIPPPSLPPPPVSTPLPPPIPLFPIPTSLSLPTQPPTFLSLLPNSSVTPSTPHPCPPPPLLPPTLPPLSTTLSSTSLPHFGPVPPPHGERYMAGGVSLSLAQTVTEMASNSVDDSTMLPHTTDGATDASDEQFGTVLTGNDTRAMENCPMSLEVCLVNGREVGSGTYPPSADGGSGADQNGSQMELERQSKSGSGLFSGVSNDKRNPFTDNSVVPHPSDDQMSSVVVDQHDQTDGDNGIAPYPRDDQMSSGMAPYSGDNQMTSGVVHFSDDEQPDSSMTPHTSDDQIRSGLVLFRNDSYFDDDSQYSGYVSSTLLRKHTRFETGADEDDHDEPYRDGPSHPPPEVPLDYHTELQLFGPPPTKLHRSRLGSRDHPSRLSCETRRNIEQYHRSQLQRLQDTIGQLKEAIMVERSNSPLHSHPPPHQY